MDKEYTTKGNKPNRDAQIMQKKKKERSEKFKDELVPWVYTSKYENTER